MLYEVITIYGKAAERDGDCKEVVMGLVGEQSPLKVGHDMQTTIPGLYAVGDLCYCGSGATGAVPAPPGRNRGSGILNAVFNGLIAAESVSEYDKDSDRTKAADSLVDEFVITSYSIHYTKLYDNDLLFS